MPAITTLIKGKNPRFMPWIIEENEIENFVEQISNSPDSAEIQIGYVLKTSYLKSLEPKGENNIIVAVRDNNTSKYVGWSVISKKIVFIGGIKEKIAYVSELFLDSEYRNHIVFGLFVRMLLHFTVDCKGYLSTVMYDNKKVLNMLLSGKGKMVPYRDFGTINTLAFYSKKINKVDADIEISVKKAEEQDLDKLIQFWNEESVNNQFLPVYSVDILKNSKGLLRDLKIDDVILSIKNNKIVGSIAIWNQMAIKKAIIKKYPYWIKKLRPVINLLLKIRGIPVLPKENTEIDYRLISMLVVKNNESAVFKLLLNAIKKEINKKEKSTLLLMSLHEKNRLIQFIDFPYYNLKSKMIFASKGANIQEKNIVPYIELGSL